MTSTTLSPTDGPVASARQGGDPGAAVTAESDRYLTFVLGGEVFALPILDVTEIIEFRNLTVVPMMPAFTRGVINLRGRVVPVVDMAVRFGRGATEVGRRTSIIIVEVDPAGRDDVEGTGDAARHMGIMVDAVNKVAHLGRDDIQPPPVFGGGIRTDFISGMAKFNGDFIIVLDVTHVLSLEEMVQISHSAGASTDETMTEVAAG